jgi:hypothetical protein
VLAEVHGRVVDALLEAGDAAVAVLGGAGGVAVSDAVAEHQAIASALRAGDATAAAAAVDVTSVLSMPESADPAAPEPGANGSEQAAGMQLSSLTLALSGHRPRRCLPFGRAVWSDHQAKLVLMTGSPELPDRPRPAVDPGPEGQ